MTLRNIADTDLDEQGRLRHTFCALHDYDAAGKRALRAASELDSRLRPGAELFHLRPVMPLRRGADPEGMCQRVERENASFRSLDWEIEDLLPPSMLEVFEIDYPNAVISKKEAEGRTHRELTRDGKHHLLKFKRMYATLSDVIEIIRLLRVLREYQMLHCDHIIC